MSGAVLRVTGESGASAGSASGADGSYRLPLPDPGLRFVLAVRAPGFAPVSVLLSRPAAAASITQAVRLDWFSVTLRRVNAYGSRLHLPGEHAAPGDRGEDWLSVLTEEYPLEPGDLSALAALTPGVLRAGAGDSSGVSIAGQAPSETRATLDGTSYGGASLPAEAVQSARTVVSTWDVSRGQFSGGQTAVTTRSGGTAWGGAASFTLRDPWLQYGTGPGAPGADRFRFLQASAGGGGPLARGRLQVYGAAQFARRTSDAAFLDTSGVAALRNLGVSADSVRRLFSILSTLGGAALPRPPLEASTIENGSALLRLDYRATARQQLTLRLDWRGSRASALGASPLAVGGAEGAQRSRDGGLFVQLAPLSGAGNRFRAYLSAGARRIAPRFAVPAGVVEVASDFDDGSRGVAELSFGGNPLLAYAARYRVGEASDEVARELGGGTHRVKLGVELRNEQTWLERGTNAWGTFRFGSLGSLEAGTPDSFTRAVGARTRSAEAANANLYLGDEVRASEALQLTVGARAELSWYPSRPDGDPAVRTRFGRDPGRVPNEFAISPRIGFVWSIPGSRISLNGGAGAFRGRLSTGALAGPLSETGIAAESSITCAGASVPTPRWGSYLYDPGSIPDDCGGSGPTGATPPVSLFAPGFGAHRTWRVSLGASSALSGRTWIDASALLVRGVREGLATDLNLVREPRFALAGEGGRPVFVDAAEIDPATGRAAPAASRIDPAFGTARLVTGEGSSWTRQLTVSLTGMARHGTSYGISWVLTRTTDLAGAVPAVGGAYATTGGDPFHPERAAGDLQQLHTVQGTLRRQLGRGVTLAAIGRLASGIPFSPMVAGDVNGDAIENDRAYVFDPAATADPELAAGMRALLESGTASARKCLERQLGRVAARNSCATPWSPSLDLQATLRAPAASRRILVTLQATNVTAGLDYLLHGSRGLHGWGQYPLPDRTLLYVRGFDPATRSFRYEVNRRFGELAATRGLFRSPFALSLQMRVAVGADPSFQPLARMVNALRQGAASPEAVREALAERVVNVPARVLALNGAAGLDVTPPQLVELRAAADSAQPRLDALVGELGTILSASSPARRTPPQRERLQALLRDAARELAAGRQAARRVLTDAQWEKLPASLKQPVDGASLIPPQQVEVPVGGP